MAGRCRGHACCAVGVAAGGGRRAAAGGGCRRVGAAAGCRPGAVKQQGQLESGVQAARQQLLAVLLRLLQGSCLRRQPRPAASSMRGRQRRRHGSMERR